LIPSLPASFWKSEMENRPLLRLRLDPDSAAEPFEHLLANSQADSGALVLLSAVQTLEKDENPLKVLRIDSDAVVAHRKCPFVAAAIGDGDVYVRSRGTAIFNRVPDEILKYLRQLPVVARNGRKTIVCYNRTALLNSCT